MSATSLRTAAAARNLQIGAAVAAGPLQDDRLYAETLGREFGLVTPENVAKFGPVHPEQDRYHFGPLDAIVEFAGRHQMQARGHTLVWHSQLADWVTAAERSPEGWRGLLSDHVAAVVGRYRSRIAAWDVVNEALNDDGSLRDTPWLRALGPEYLDLAFCLAHQADPEARLFYNDYGAEGMGTKSDAVVTLARDFLDRDLPLHGVGLQMHVGVGHCPPPEQVAANMARLAELGLEVQITELDVRVEAPFRDEDLRRQTDIYRDLLQVCLEAPNCTALVLWGFSDRHSWVPSFFKGWGKALIFDEEYRPKPAYEALLKTLVEPL